MPPATLPGFTTKKQASRLYRRSRRQLTRDLSKAMLKRDEKLLKHVKLRTEDGILHDGTDITTQAILQMKADGKNPVWYVSTNWMEQTYGLRTERDTPNTKKDDSIPPDAQSDHNPAPATAPRRDAVEQTQPAEAEQTGSGSNHVLDERVRWLEDKVHGLEEDKRHLRSQLVIKDQQLTERTELQKELHRLMGHLQERLLLPGERAARKANRGEPPAPETPVPDAHTQEPLDVAIDEAPATVAERGTVQTKPTRPKNKPDSLNTKPSSRKKKASPKPSLISRFRSSIW